MRTARASAIRPGSTPMPSSAPRRPPSGSASTTTRRRAASGHAAARPSTRLVAPGEPATEPTATIVIRQPLRRGRRGGGRRPTPPPRRARRRAATRTDTHSWPVATGSTAHTVPVPSDRGDLRHVGRAEPGGGDVEQLDARRRPRAGSAAPRRGRGPRRRRPRRRPSGTSAANIAGDEHRARRDHARRVPPDERAGLGGRDRSDAGVDGHPLDAQVAGLRRRRRAARSVAATSTAVRSSLDENSRTPPSALSSTSRTPATIHVGLRCRASATAAGLEAGRRGDRRARRAPHGPAPRRRRGAAGAGAPVSSSSCVGHGAP